MRRLQVLFITPWYPTTVDPVAGVFIREHARAVQLYNDVVVVHAVGSRRDLHRPWQMEQDTDAAICQGIPTYHIWARRPAGLPAAYLHRAWAVQQACQLIIKNGFQPDIIHAHISAMGLPAALVARRHRLPMVISEHASTFPRREMTPLNLLIAKLAFGSAHRVLPVSRFLQQAIEAYGIRARFEIVPNVVDTEIFQPLGGSSAPGEVKHILFVGSMGTDRVKGLAFLLQALATLKQTNWHLDLIGDGPCRADYMQLAQELGIQTRLTFHGQKTKAELAEHMRRCDFLVSSSLIETFGIVLL